MTRTNFSLSPSAAPDDLTSLMYGGDDDEDMGQSPQATDIFQPGGGVYLMRILMMKIPQKVSFRLMNRLSGESV